MLDFSKTTAFLLLINSNFSWNVPFKGYFLLSVSTVVIKASIEKILGDFDRKLLDQAIDDYIEKYYRKIISPLLQQRDLKGKKKFTQASAVQFVRDRIVKNYCS